ncbi:MAG: filamentous hemagglutinin N-terminal domain-containing protein, partial [Shewanella sp.]|nr:filamentous hemagglutinin N-terminal domain-containing protein [Shewanella sp.]
MKKVRLFLSVYLSLYLAFSPLVVVAAGIVADGGTQTTTGAARNGVPVVNIANPNATGLSHNTFTDYNVNANGVILNNATGTVSTQLGGFINGNAHLSQGASVILNEVTSTRSSNLNGFTEVAGQRADLVIANPNGLTINGAGFINTSNVMLTTGKPNIVNGSIGSVDVRGGRITIQGAGLNTMNQNSTQIYANYVTLNAQLHAQNLDVKLGKSVIGYAGKNIISSSNGAATGLLLDASALGGMYANSISLVGTEKGLGVNLPPEVIATLGDISISNDGNIVMQGLNASQQINVQSQSDITGSGTVYGGSNVVLNAVRGVVNTGTVAAQQGVSISSSSLTNSGTVVAGIAPNGQLNTTGSVNINSALVNNTGKLQSTGNMVVNATRLNNSGTLYAGTDLSVTAADVINTNKVLSDSTLSINATSIVNQNANADPYAGIISLGNMVLSAASLDNTGANIHSAGNQDITVAGTLTNVNGLIQGDGNTVLSTTHLNNTGGVLEANNLTLTTNTI